MVLQVDMAGPLQADTAEVRVLLADTAEVRVLLADTVAHHQADTADTKQP
jgi:hypothetical protein